MTPSTRMRYSERLIQKEWHMCYPCTGTQLLLSYMFLQPLHRLSVCDIDGVVVLFRLCHTRRPCLMSIVGNLPVETEVQIQCAISNINKSRVHVVTEVLVDLADEGFEAEIASYTYSDEYLNNFGIDSVPYARTQTSVDGESTVAYQRNQAMDPGFAGFDANQASVLQVSLASNSNPTAAGTRKVVGGGNRFTVLWTSRVQLGSVRRSAQRSVVSYASLSRTIQSIQAQGGNILSIANA